jgi:hypothetical protein
MKKRFRIIFSVGKAYYYDMSRFQNVSNEQFGNMIYDSPSKFFADCYFDFKYEICNYHISMHPNFVL